MSVRDGRIDKVILISTLIIAVMGILFVQSATFDRNSEGMMLSDLAMRQCVWVFVGIFLLMLILNTQVLKILDLAYLIYILNLILLFYLLIFCSERYGAKRWINVGPVSIQPSEFIKLTVILVLSAFLGERREKMGSFGNFLGAVLLVAPAILLIFIQPDLGTAFILIPVLFSILFICGEKIRYIAGTVVLGILSFPVFWHLLKDYQRTRLLVFLNPNLDPLGAGYTIIQSKIAIGSGGIFGKGWMNGTQSYLKFLPEKHTDFIFSVIGEETGLVGALFLVGLYALIIWRGIMILYGTKSVYERTIVIGVITLLASQVFLNIAMTIGLMPVVGIPLPAISYGGSNTVTTFIAIAFLLDISKRAYR